MDIKNSSISCSTFEVESEFTKKRNFFWACITTLMLCHKKYSLNQLSSHTFFSNIRNYPSVSFRIMTEGFLVYKTKNVIDLMEVVDEYRERDLNPRPTDYDSDALTS